MNCACGARLYVAPEQARGTCNACHMAAERVVLRSKSSLTPKRTVVLRGEAKGESETKQQRWRRKNAEAWREINRESQQRYRDRRAD